MCVVAVSCSDVATVPPGTGGGGTDTTTSGSTVSMSGGSGGQSGSTSTTSTASTTSMGGAGGSSTGSTSSSASGGSGGQGTGGGQGGSGPLTVKACYDDKFVSPPAGGPDYDQYHPTVGSHCQGTNHQDITGIERVVFLGDSVTVGTPPTFSTDFYRAKLADALSAKFGLPTADIIWKSANPFNGMSITQSSGPFWSCAKWGARTDDLIQDSTQIADCFPQSELDKRTLVIMTMGGNDLSSLTKAATEGATMNQLWTQAQDFVNLQRGAVEWFKEPGRFPNGVFVIFANMYEFTDGTGDVQACDVSGLAGFSDPVPSPAELAAVVVWANEQYLKIAVDTQTDMIFMLEDFCGHGFNADDPTAPCYRGPGQEVWFDLTCIHPNPTGHQHIADMFMAVVNE